MAKWSAVPGLKELVEGYLSVEGVETYGIDSMWPEVIDAIQRFLEERSVVPAQPRDRFDPAD